MTAQDDKQDDVRNALLGLHKAVKQLAQHFDKPITDENVPLWLALNSAQDHAAKVLESIPSAGGAIADCCGATPCKWGIEGLEPCKAVGVNTMEPPPVTPSHGLSIDKLDRISKFLWSYRGQNEQTAWALSGDLDKIVNEARMRSSERGITK